MIIGAEAGNIIATIITAHMAMKSGMLVAETIIDGLIADDFTAHTLGGYTERFRDSWAYQEHLEARNFTGSIEMGTPFGMGLNIPLMMITQGRGLIDPNKTHPRHTAMKKEWEVHRSKDQPDPYHSGRR